MANGLRALTPEMQSLIESLSDPVIVLDRDYLIVGSNPAYRNHYADSNAVKGRHCYEVSHRYQAPCDQAGAACVCPRKQAEVTGRTQRVMHIHFSNRGEEYVEVNLSPIRDASGKIVLFLERIQWLPSASPADGQTELVGKSPAFVDMLHLVARVAPTDTTALLLGETGTGKELVAQAIHAESKRATGPFVPVDCSGLTETLFENELFGHEKGAFTGAGAPKVGLIEAAEGGTLFLDEIGDIPLAEQVKLLRLIETGTYRRVGGVEPRRANVRLVAATHRDLGSMIEEGTFRRDLYYRISAFPIHLPALRQRPDDIPRLAQSILGRLQPYRALSIEDEAMALLCAYDYPGNVRELRNILERASLLANNDRIRPKHLPVYIRRAAHSDIERGQFEAAQPPLQSAERATLQQVLARNAGNRAATARALGISERSLYRKLAKLGLARSRNKTK